MKSYLISLKQIYFFSVLCLLCLCARLFICALWSPAGKGLASRLSFGVSGCEFVTFPSVSWVRCGTWLYRFLIFAPLLTSHLTTAKPLQKLFCIKSMILKQWYNIYFRISPSIHLFRYLLEAPWEHQRKCLLDIKYCWFTNKLSTSIFYHYLSMTPLIYTIFWCERWVILYGDMSVIDGSKGKNYISGLFK